MQGKKSKTADVKVTEAATKTAEKTASSAEKNTATKESAKKTAAKKFAPKETVILQFAGLEFDFDKIVKAVKTDCKKKFKGAAKTLEIYVKPEDRAVYYVVNGDLSDKIEL